MEVSWEDVAYGSHLTHAVTRYVSPSIIKIPTGGNCHKSFNKTYSIPIDLLTMEGRKVVAQKMYEATLSNHETQHASPKKKSKQQRGDEATH